ncbi:MAG: hypothetical protein LAT55_10725 [Opitutales bacterium]|nr:hypothetical protein [Opitutales bacterium]
MYFRRFNPGFFLWPLVLLLIGAGISSLSAQVRPDQPVQNFRLPFFAPDGLREWEALGAKATYRDGESILLEDSRMRFFDRAEGAEETLVVTSPSAVLDLDGDFVYGDDELTLTHALGAGRGDRWRFADESRVLTVEGNVRVVLQRQPSDLFQFPRRQDGDDG